MDMGIMKRSRRPNKVQRSGQERLPRRFAPPVHTLSRALSVCAILFSSRAHTLQLPRVFESLFWRALVHRLFILAGMIHRRSADALQVTWQTNPVIEILASAANNENRRSSFKAEHTPFSQYICCQHPNNNFHPSKVAIILRALYTLKFVFVCENHLLQNCKIETEQI
jgi:hypothetical protein